MVGRVAERVEHQDRVRHCRIDRAEAVLAIEALGDESRGGVDRAAAQRRRKKRLRALEQPVDRAEELHRPAHAWWAPVGHLRTVSGGAVNSSPIVTPRGLAARGFSACRTRSGTITVRAQ